MQKKKNVFANSTNQLAGKILQFARLGIRYNMQLTKILGIVFLLQLLPLIQLDLTATAFLLLSGNATEFRFAK